MLAKAFCAASSNAWEWHPRWSRLFADHQDIPPEGRLCATRLWVSWGLPLGAQGRGHCCRYVGHPPPRRGHTASCSGSPGSGSGAPGCAEGGFVQEMLEPHGYPFVLLSVGTYGQMVAPAMKIYIYIYIIYIYIVTNTQIHARQAAPHSHSTESIA
jgi:hypothetical protein